MPNNKDGKVIDFKGPSSLDFDPDRILQASIGKVESAIVIGWDKNGDFYFNSSISGGPEVLWLIEIARKQLIRA